MNRRGFLLPSTLSALPCAVLAALTAFVLAGCGGTPSKSAPVPATPAAAREFPECRKARQLCGEANPSPGIREACLRAARDCREARNTPPENPSPSPSPEPTP